MHLRSSSRSIGCSGTACTPPPPLTSGAISLIEQIPLTRAALLSLSVLVINSRCCVACFFTLITLPFPFSLFHFPLLPFVYCCPLCLRPPPPPPGRAHKTRPGLPPPPHAPPMLPHTFSSLLRGCGSGVPGPSESWPCGCLANTTMTSRYIWSREHGDITRLCLQSSEQPGRCLLPGLTDHRSLADSEASPTCCTLLPFGLWLSLFTTVLLPLSLPAWFNIKMHLWDTWIIKSHSAYLLP